MLRASRPAPAPRRPLRPVACAHEAPAAPRPEVARAAAACLAPLLLDASREPAAAVRRALRAGSGRGPPQASPSLDLDNDGRAALARLVLGAGVARARLAHQAAAARARLEATSADGVALLHAAAAAGEPGADAAEPLREAAALDAARVLLALYLLHGAGDAHSESSASFPEENADSEDSESSFAAWPAADVEAALLGLELPPDVLAALRGASPAAVTWPGGVAGLAARRSLPRWLAAELTEQLGDAHADALGAALAAPGPVTLRVNALKAASPADVAAELDAAGVATAPGRHSPAALRLPRGRPRLGLLHLPGWRDGCWEVQDEGSQLIASAVNAAPGEAVLDLCAGNGGKALALAAAVGAGGRVLAYDVAPQRLAALRASALRAGAHDIVATCASAEQLLSACDDVAAARGGIAAALVDAPCSGVGALRRRPGDRWALRRSDAVDVAPAMQRALLSLAAALLLKSGAKHARLVYATCSLLRQENADVAAWFTAAHAADFEPWPLEDAEHGADAAFRHAMPPEGLPGPPPLAHERTLLPHAHGTDGFYVARWRRRA